MQFRKFSADTIYPVASSPIKDAVITTDLLGTILKIDSMKDHDSTTVEKLEGVLVPGFINTHCHLELSHMKGKVNTGTTLIPFITDVVTKRNVEKEQILDAITKGEQEMYLDGIVAVGDISNTVDTVDIKQKSSLWFYTFIELFDFLQNENAGKALEDWLPIFNTFDQSERLKKSMVPHAPYSVSTELFKKINEVNGNLSQTISIHNQETMPENELFINKKGMFLDFYAKFGISLDRFSATGHSSIYYALQHLDPNQKTLFVHNTLTTETDIIAAQQWNKNIYWATCPNANLYIENRLPNYQNFLNTNSKVTIGTDSLTSNWQLSIMEEMKTISKYQSYLPFETILKWATINGAEALGFDKNLGSFEVGKRPGIVQITGLENGNQLNSNTKSTRII